MSYATRTLRRRTVDFALRLTTGTSVAPDAYELAWLEQYVDGKASLERIIALTEQHRLALVAKQ